MLADKIYRNWDNLHFCAEHGIRLSGLALGRPKKDALPDKRQDYADICERVEVECHISLAKRKCGLGLLTTRLKKTTAGSGSKQGRVRAPCPKRTKIASAVLSVFLLVGLLPKPAGRSVPALSV